MHVLSSDRSGLLAKQFSPPTIHLTPPIAATQLDTQSPSKYVELKMHACTNKKPTRHPKHRERAANIFRMQNKTLSGPRGRVVSYPRNGECVCECVVHFILKLEKTVFRKGEGSISLETYS